MRKPLSLLIVSLCTLFCQAQKTDTLVLYYRPDQYTISKQDRQKLDSFLHRGWDRIFINGYTDETDEEGYNLELSKKRASQVYNYFIARKFESNSLSSQHYGEKMPKADNSSDDGRALNRRTEVIGFQFARVTIKPKITVDPMKPVTKTLDNGFIITYRSGAIPEHMAQNFESGSGMNFQLITNTAQMRQNAMYNNTTNGEILSSVLIICGRQFNPCKLDSPIMIKVPIPVSTNCPIEKVKFFNTVVENGKRIWQEQTKQLYPEVINGRKYIRIWMDNFCECINFDFKIDPECYDTDSVRILYVNASIKNLSAELKGMNSVYLPRKVNDSTYNVIYLKDKQKDAAITFSLYKDKRRIRSFRDQVLASFPYNENAKGYVLTTSTVQLYFPRLKMADVVLKVNNDKYRVMPERNRYEFLYLSRNDEKVLVDFTIVDSRGRVMQFRDQPVDSLPFDENGKFRVVDKKFIKALKETNTIAGL